MAEKCEAQGTKAQYDGGWLTPGFDNTSWKAAVGYHPTPTSTSTPIQTPTQTLHAGTGPTFSGTAGPNAASNPGTMAYVKPYSNQISTESADN